MTLPGPSRRQRWRRLTGPAVLAAATTLATGGTAAIVVAVKTQQHAPQPGPRAAGSLNPGRSYRYQSARPPGPGRPHSLAASQPVRIDIPRIGVRSAVRRIGLAPDGSIQVPRPGPGYDQAAWFDQSVTPGQIGASIIEGHVDSAAAGPSVFFRLGALRPGNRIRVRLADRVTAIFTVTGVREYPKELFPAALIYASSGYPALRLITCGGSFDPATGHYLSSTVVFTALTQVHRAQPQPPDARGRPHTHREHSESHASMPPAANRPPAHQLMQ